MSQEQNVWGRESRRDGHSEWASTSFSTISGELRTPRPANPRRRHRRATYLRFMLPLLIALACGSVGVLRLAQHLHG